MPDDLRSRSAREVLDDHLNIAQNWGGTSMEEILEADLRRNVAEDIVILINRGTFRGHEGVKDLAMMLAEELPEHNAFQYTYTAVEGKMAFSGVGVRGRDHTGAGRCRLVLDRGRQDRRPDDPLHGRA